MTNLKDKLSASVRQAKASTQPAFQPAARAAVTSGGSPPPAAAKPPATPPIAAKAIQPLAASGIAFPDRVWPD